MEGSESRILVQVVHGKVAQNGEPGGVDAVVAVSCGGHRWMVQRHLHTHAGIWTTICIKPMFMEEGTFIVDHVEHDTHMQEGRGSGEECPYDVSLLTGLVIPILRKREKTRGKPPFGFASGRNDHQAHRLEHTNAF